MPVGSEWIVGSLRCSRRTSSNLQQARHDADYDNSRVSSRTQAYEEILKAEVSIAAWSTIREDEMAQDYLYDLWIPAAGDAPKATC